MVAPRLVVEVPDRAPPWGPVRYISLEEWDVVVMRRTPGSHKVKKPILYIFRGEKSWMISYLIEKTVRPAALQHFSEVPVAVLNAAGKAGRYDDMTVLALRPGGR